MDSIRVSEAPDTGSIPVEATNTFGVSINVFPVNPAKQSNKNFTFNQDDNRKSSAVIMAI